MAEFWSNDDRGYRIRLWLDQVSQDISGNSSQVRVRLALLNTYTTFAEYNCSAFVDLNGQRLNWTGRPSVLNQHSTLWLIDQTITVGHNSDGSKAFGFTAQFSGSGGWSPNTLTVGAGTFTLTTIPRSSSVSVGSGVIGSPMTITINRQSNSFTHTLRYHWGNKQGTIASNAGGSYTWTIPNDFANDVPNSTSGTGTIYVDTYSGSTKTGTQSVAFSAIVPDSFRPSLTGFTLLDNNTAARNLIPGGQHFIQIVSNIAVNFGQASGSYGSTISGYYAEIVGKNQSTTANGGLLGTMNYNGSITIRARVTDSRGRTSNTIERTVTVLDYFAPVLSFDVTRSGASSSTLTVRRNARVAPLNVNGSQKNTMTLSFKTAPLNSRTTTVNNGSASGSWSSMSTLTNSSANLAGDFPANRSFTVIGVLEDRFTRTEFSVNVATEKVVMGYDKDGRVGIGQIPEVGKAGSLNVAGDIYAGGRLTQMHALTAGNPALGRIKWDNTTHVDDLVESGYYWANKGTPTNSWGVLEVYRVGDKETAQFFTVGDGGKTFARLKHWENGTWSVWKTRGLDQFYPVGAIYQSTNATDPTTLMGGTWTRFGQGRVLVGVSESETEFNTVNKTGGAKTHTLNLEEIPSHSHAQRVTANTGNGTAIRRDWSSDVPSGQNALTYPQGIDTAATGGGRAHNNLQPYITVYMWQRTA